MRSSRSVVNPTSRRRDWTDNGSNSALPRRPSEDLAQVRHRLPLLEDSLFPAENKLPPEFDQHPTALIVPVNMGGVHHIGIELPKCGVDDGPGCFSRQPLAPAFANDPESHT